MIKENAKMGSVHIADLAPQNLRPINPPPSRLISIGVFLGLLFGVALAILLELLDTTVATPDDVRASLSLTTLGSVPRLTHKPPLQGADFVSFMRTKHPYAEAFRTLRSHLKFLRSDRPFKTLLFTSTRAGEGKTQVTGSLGVVLALAGHKVILVDADLRHPSMHRLFDVPNARGLTHALVGDADVASCLSQTPIPNLFLMTAGAIPPNPAELLEGERISHVLKAVSEQADFVLIDSPPALIVTDATILAGRTDVVDGVILVIESAKVPREAVQRSKEMIERAKGNLCGVILNKISLKHGRSYYYYHYYYYPYYGGEGDQMKQQVPS